MSFYYTGSYEYGLNLTNLFSRNSDVLAFISETFKPRSILKNPFTVLKYKRRHNHYTIEFILLIIKLRNTIVTKSCYKNITAIMQLLASHSSTELSLTPHWELSVHLQCAAALHLFGPFQTSLKTHFLQSNSHS